jgi:hypothetical protein
MNSSPNVRGIYRGFFQSVDDPNVRGPAELNINFQEPPEPDFQGSITILGNTYAITVKVDADGHLKFTSREGVTGTGTWQDLTRGGAIVLASYRLSSGDEGKVDVLRGFTDPPEPNRPPDIAGSWRGTIESRLSLMMGKVQWDVQQDRTKTGAPSTGFTGRETVDLGAAGIIIYGFVGTIDGQGIWCALVFPPGGLSFAAVDGNPAFRNLPRPSCRRTLF